MTREKFSTPLHPHLLFYFPATSFLLSCQVTVRPEQTFGNFNPRCIFSHLSSAPPAQLLYCEMELRHQHLPRPSPEAGQVPCPAGRPVTGTAGSTKSAQTPQNMRERARGWPQAHLSRTEAGLCQSCWHIHEILWRHSQHQAYSFILHNSLFVSMEKDLSPSYSKVIFTHQLPTSLVAVSCVGCPD